MLGSSLVPVYLSLLKGLTPQLVKRFPKEIVPGLIF